MRARIPLAYFAIPAIAAVAGLLGGISASWWAATLIGIGCVAAWFTMDTLLVRRVLFGKIGKSVMTWWLVQLTGETLALAIIAGVLAFFGVHFVGLVGLIAAVCMWAVICGTTARTVMLMLAMAIK